MKQKVFQQGFCIKIILSNNQILSLLTSQPSDGEIFSFFPPKLKQWPHPTHSLTCKSHTYPLLWGKARSHSRPFSPRVKHVQVSLLPHGWDGLLPTNLTFPRERHSGHCGLAFQSSSVAQSCPTLCNPMNRNTPGLPAHHQLPEFTQTHAHRVGDAIQPSHPLSSSSPPAPNPSQGWLIFFLNG